ncbi:MAG: hypothetical protein JO110_03275 [Acetobacteraceae bacterium]|nr:hypothetical protein [Acetobacteraceae bacterium]
MAQNTSGLAILAGDRSLRPNRGLPPRLLREMYGKQENTEKISVDVSAHRPYRPVGRRRNRGATMSESLQLFIELMNSRNLHEVGTALDDYAQAQVGGQLSDLPFRYLGGRENNRGPVEVMESVENAAYEKIMNGYDALGPVEIHSS